MNDDIAISADRISKDFKLPHEKISSVKSIFVRGLKSRNSGTEVQHALKNISFQVKKGEFFGIVGRNGSGKSTLLKILAEIYQPTNGTVKRNGLLVPFIELGVGFNPELTGRENVYLNGAILGFSLKQVDEMYEGIVAFAELERFMDQKLKNYSSGMQVRLAFAMATRAQADILLVDEVLAVGDADFQRKCFSYFKELKANKKTVVFVTHDMNAVREYCDRAMLLDKSEIQFMGSAEDTARQYSELFMDNMSVHAKKGNGKRWGNGAVKVDNVITKVDGENIVINVSAKASEEVDKVCFGLHILAEDGSEITAMNNRMINVPDLKAIKPGDTMTFKWKMLNIFNDGKYYVMLTLIDDMTNTLDWFVRADSFIVKRQNRSTTAVLPPITVKATID